MKTAPLFEAACALGIRAAKNDWLINLGKQYGYNCGMAFQIFDDYCDLIQVVGQPWEAASKGSLPSSLHALRQRVGGDGVVTDENDTDVLDMDAVSSLLLRPSRARSTSPLAWLMYVSCPNFAVTRLSRR